MGYNKETDYQSKINEAVSKGDYESAAKYEQSRNEKIDGENLGYEKTNRYSGWLDKTDYSNVLRKQMSSGASKNDVSETLKKRISKATGTDGLTQYAYDDVYDQAIRYIMEKSSYGERPQYKNSYESEISKILERLTKIKEFSYNPYEDELYEFYKQQYLREGSRAMEDLLGELSASTGGIASSYAVSAAAQARENYNHKLTDKIPELYEAAYEQYLDGIDTDESILKIIQALSDGEYEKYLDSMNIYNKDRELYNKERELYNKEKEFEYKVNAAEEEDEYNRNQDMIDTALTKWKNLGYLDEESAKILGLPAGLHTTDYDYKKAQQYKIYSR